MSDYERRGDLIPIATVDHPGSVWNVALQTHSRGEPIRQAAMWRSVALQPNVPSSLTLEFWSPCPLSSTNQQGISHCTLSAQSASHVCLCSSIFRVAGVPARRRPNIGQVMPWRRTVALISLLFSAANRAGNGPMLHQPVAFRGRCHRNPAWMQNRVTFYSAHAPIWSDMGPEHSVLYGELSNAASRTSFWIFNLSQKRYSNVWWPYHAVYEWHSWEGFPLIFEVATMI